MTTGPAHWLWLALALFAALSLALPLLVSHLRARELETRTVCMRCPVRDTAVVCTAVRNRQSGAWTGIRSCSALTPPEEVNCGRSCLSDLKRLPQLTHA